MMTAHEEMFRLRKEARGLRIKNGQLEYRCTQYKKHIEECNDLIRRQDNLLKRMEKDRKEQQKIIDELKRQRDTYRGMVYKSNVLEQTPETGIPSQKHRGGQPGHIGHARFRSQHIDRDVRVHATICPDCQTPIPQTNTVTTHTIEDIPAPQAIQPIVTLYTVERQWCPVCKKEIQAIPATVIPGSRFGLNLIVQLLIWKYRCRIPFATMMLLFSTTYGITITEGALVAILHRSREWLGSSYDDLLKEIRGSPVKHADETGWRISGINSWVWAFLTKNTAYYTIEETRGKGVPERILAGSKATDILVRDDYAGYEKLPMVHQSCWAHLLRKSHEGAAQPGATEEMKNLHKTLISIYQTITMAIRLPVASTERIKVHEALTRTISDIVATRLGADDAKRIQTRIRNQETNLFTALLYDGVPLTNNLAERTIRPMVVTRKVSGGSRSVDGAQTHAVNMSILQTITMRNQPLSTTLHTLLLQGAFGKR